MNYIPLGGGVITDDANATASQILSGYTAYVKGKKITGNIPSQGAQTITPGTTNKTIASGKYLSGTQTIKGDANLTAGNIKAGTSIFGVSGTYTNDANADGLKIYEGMKVYSKGNAVIGTLPERNVVGRNSALSINSSWPNVALHEITYEPQFNVSPTNNKLYCCTNVPRGYYNGSSYVGFDPRMLYINKRYEAMGLWGIARNLILYSAGTHFYTTNDNWSLVVARPIPSDAVIGFRVVAMATGQMTWSIRVNDVEIRNFSMNQYTDFSFQYNLKNANAIGVIPIGEGFGVCAVLITF